MAKVTKLKAVEPKAASPSKPKILVFGKPGVGKTWTSLDFPSCYYIDTEGGADLEHYTDKLKKSGGMYYGPDQGSQDFDNVIEQIKALATEEHGFRTLIIDSYSKLFNLEISKEAERLANAGLKNEFAADKKPAVKYTGRLISWINRLDMNVILICHEKPLWAKGEQIGVTFDGHEKLEYELHLCLNILKMGDSRKAMVKKTRLLQFPDATTFEWSYDKFSTMYGKEIMEAQAKAVVLATPEQVAEVNKLLENIKLTDSTKDKWIAENLATMNEIESDKVDGVILHLKAKLAPIDAPKPPKEKVA